MKSKIYRAGLDVGSTTAKLVVVNDHKQIIFSDYLRHNTRIHQTITQLLQNAKTALGDKEIALAVTGSAGIGVSEKVRIPFIQEVIASTGVIRQCYPQVKTLIDIGGEDSKMIFFHKNKPPDIRMNGSCAGGTGAFIDQMAALLNVPVARLNDLAEKARNTHLIASRCGVFAKTDVQNLLSRKIPKEDIALSVFHAVAVQTMNTLARGYDIQKKIMFVGGPFAFLPALRRTFISDLELSENDILTPEHPTLLPAWGAAIENVDDRKELKISTLCQKVEQAAIDSTSVKNRLSPLFKNQQEFETWHKNRFQAVAGGTRLEDYRGETCFLGIDSGSTTTKIVATGENNELLFRFYTNNHGNPVETVKQGLEAFVKAQHQARKTLRVARTAVTGYGEELIKTAYSIDAGIVETIAHFTAARHFCPSVSFILDIGGQDMKAIFVQNGAISRIELNESCSSGCGSFIQTFGSSLGYAVSDFATLACRAQAPCDLGTRCTVFMNSKVKQSLRENATTADISAGLAISVIKNALFKVLKLKNIEELGEHIVVQGGTFRNPSVHRALEVLAQKRVICSDMPELMGAFGAALMAQHEFLRSKKTPTAFVGLENLRKANDYATKQLHCKGCENVCAISRFTFANGKVFYSGNKCEKIFSNKAKAARKGENLFSYKYNLLFARSAKPAEPMFRIGIPRVLNMYENYPFWHTLLTQTGIEVVLSDTSTMPLYEKGAGTVMSDSICFPAKLVHGHIYNLVEKQVNRIFFPMVVYEQKEFQDAENSFNCPVVSSYPDVIKSAMNPEEKFDIPIDSPTFNFNDKVLLRKACFRYLQKYGVSRTAFNRAFVAALQSQYEFKAKIREKGAEIIENARKENRLLVVLAGRPYHTDPLINHKTPEILEELGVDTLTEDVVPFCVSENFSDLQVISQWEYPNRIYNAALWAGEQPDNVQFVQFNSFGCGPDAIAVDESIEILRSKGKNHTLIRVDDITSTGSVRLRLRSMIESYKLKETAHKTQKPRQNTVAFEPEDMCRTILAPTFSEIYSVLLPALFKIGGYKLENLPIPDKASVEYGLKYSNNEICYPATVVVGDIIKALKSGKYKREEVAVGITQTGGQCRASSYLSLIKKAMVAAGYADVPVIAVGTAGKTINPQPGFNLPWKKIMTPVFVAMLFADSLAKLYYASVVREKKKGAAKKLLNSYLELGVDKFEAQDIHGFFELLRMAVTHFNRLETDDTPRPKIGIVGEIYVKYNSFGHQNVVQWLIEQGVEVVVPPIVDFFIQEFVNFDVNKKAYLSKKSVSTDLFVFYLKNVANRYVKRANKILADFRFYQPFHKISDIANKASKILNLANQFGEGWLIPAEVASFADDRIYNVVSLQPFGCIANHIISKGVEKRIKDIYPEISLLFLDFDDGTSEVNVLNRLHFMVKNVKEAMRVKEA